MKQLIADALSWEELGEIHKTEYQFELGKGVLHKEAGRLTLPIHCNFVMPFADCEKVKAVILHKLDMLKEVELDFFVPRFCDAEGGRCQTLCPAYGSDSQRFVSGDHQDHRRKPRHGQRRMPLLSGSR